MPFCFRRYLKAINIHTIFSLPQTLDPDARPGSPAPLNMTNYSNKKSAAERMLDGHCFPVKGCTGVGASPFTPILSPKSAYSSVYTSRSGSCLSRREYKHYPGKNRRRLCCPASFTWPFFITSTLFSNVKFFEPWPFTPVWTPALATTTRHDTRARVH